MAKKFTVKSYGNYYFRPQDQDPIVDFLRTAAADRPIRAKDVVAQGLSAGTYYRLFGGKTRSPKFTTVMVIARTIGPEGVEAVAKCARDGGKKKAPLRVVEGGRRKAS